ncbi:MAG: transporter [Acidobacteriota bacterium]
MKLPTALVLLLIGTGLLWAPGLQRQAEAGAWTRPRRRTWVKTSFMFQETEERYFLDGNRIPYFFEGHNRTAAGFFDISRGLTDRLEVRLQLPFWTITFNDLADNRTSTGIGDIRVGVRYNLAQAPLVATIGSTVKFPTGEFINDAETIPVGEGQYDVEVTAELGRSLWPRPGYVTGLMGYRFRTQNGETGIDFGDELIWSVEGGYHIAPRLMVKGLLRGLHGFDSTSFGLNIDSLRREIVYFEPGALFELNPSRGIEFSLPITLRGRNWPAGLVFNIGFYQEF